VILQSQVKASLSIFNAGVDLQEGFAHAGKLDGRPISDFFPLAVSSNSKAGLIFSVKLPDSDVNGRSSAGEANGGLRSESILNVRYTISGTRNVGAHNPVAQEEGSSDGNVEHLTFRSLLPLQRPVLDPCFVVGFLPIPSSGLRVGQLVTMQWRLERLKNPATSADEDEVLYEVNINSGNWMIAGKKRGYASLSTKQGSRIVISILCLPLVAGYVRPPQLSLPDVDQADISCNPPAPHLVCVLPPLLSSSYCITAS
ncbi:hypothetical protein M569_14380, partial [Genlisea aurea]